MPCLFLPVNSAWNTLVRSIIIRCSNLEVITLFTVYADTHHSSGKHFQPVMVGMEKEKPTAVSHIFKNRNKVKEQMFIVMSL